MADKSVGELIAATSVTPTDLFVLEQSGVAKKLTGQTLENWLLAMADGHGGIQSIAKASTSGLVDTYRITFADASTHDFTVTNGKGITKIAKTKTSGLVDTYTITYTDGSNGTFSVTNGAQGPKGDSQYVWIKYASEEPTSDNPSFGDLPDRWMGIYSGDSVTAPTNWSAYSWFEIKGAKGDTGEAASLVSTAVEYQVSDSGTIIPSGAWVTSVPVVAQGKYLWTRITNEFNSGLPVVSYSVSRMGLDGSGSVSSVANISPDPNGNVPLTAENIGALPISGGTMTGPVNMNGQTLNGLNAPTNADEAATKGYADGKLSLELLWQNASPNSIFSAQTISLDMAKYQYIMVDTVTTPGAVIIRKGTDAEPTSSALSLLVVSSTSANATVLQVGRRMVVVKSASVAFQDNNSTIYTTTTGSFKAVEASNSSAVPYRIYGIKGVV